MLTRIDHVTIGAADLRAGIAAYTRIGFDVDERGVARNDGDHLELVRSGDGLQSIAMTNVWNRLNVAVRQPAGQSWG